MVSKAVYTAPIVATVRSVLAFLVDGCALIHLLSTVNLLSMSLTSAARSYSTAVCIS